MRGLLKNRLEFYFRSEANLPLSSQFLTIAKALNSTTIKTAPFCRYKNNKMQAAQSLLEDRTLVLNRSWAVVNVTSVRRALTLVYQKVARVIATDNYQTHDFDSWTALSASRDQPCVHTVSFSIRVPEVIVLIAYDAFPEKHVPFSRRNLFRRDHHTCQYCGKKMRGEELTIDHVIPRSKGGRSSWENCVLACVACNVRKGDRLPLQSGLQLVRAPKRPNWTPYLSLSLGTKKESWEKFVSERYWNIELEP